MKIAIIGSRGPVIYGGFETLTEQLGSGLSKKNHETILYTRKGYKKTLKRSKKIKIIEIPSIHSKSLETITHSLLATLHACVINRPSIICFLGVGNAPFIILSRIFKIPAVINVDGFDWKRKKWGSIGKMYLILSANIAVKLSHRVITDSLVMHDYYKNKLNIDSIYIPYGFLKNNSTSSKILKKYQLKKNKFYIWTGRIIPDNNLEDLIQTANQTKQTFYVVVGDSTYSNEYKLSLNLKVKNNNVLFTGFLTRADYLKLLAKADAYIETKCSGGTHPSLIDAMGQGTLVISTNCKANKMILGKKAFYYNSPRHLSEIIKNRKRDFKERKMKKDLKKTAEKKFNWKCVVRKYEDLFSNVIQSFQSQNQKELHVR